MPEIETENGVLALDPEDDALTADEAAAADVEEDLLVEEVSIDGMCGVY